MSFDLYVWPAARRLSARSASRALARLMEDDPPGPPADARLAAFADEIRGRHPWLTGHGEPPWGTGFEFDAHAGHVFVGIGWGDIELVGGEIAEAAWRHGLAVFDPQRETVAMPASLGGTPMGWEGIEPHVEAFDGLVKRLGEVVDDGPMTEKELLRRLAEDTEGLGFRMVSPMGFEITPDLDEKLLRDPTRVPSSLQTPEHKARVLADLGTRKRGVRAQAVARLSGWGPDPDVRAVLRELLTSEDAMERWQAASGLARQGDIDSFEPLLDVVRRDSPAGDGDTGSMLLPLRAALDLAVLIGPDAVARVRALASEWRGPRPARPMPWDEELDELVR